MVKHLLCAALLAACAAPAMAASGCTPGSEFEPATCPLALPPIKRIAIEHNAAKSPQETDASVRCTGFRLTAKTVRRYLRHAGVVEPMEAHHTLDRAPCYASGTLVLADGRPAEWRIEQLRAGTLKIGSDEPLTLYCPGCRTRPFRW